jgi:hypothetical protein
MTKPKRKTAREIAYKKLRAEGRKIFGVKPPSAKEKLAWKKACEKAEMARRVRCFMDGTSWKYELGQASYGNKLYAETKSLKNSACIKECGIAEVEVRLVRWVKRPKI